MKILHVIGTNLDAGAGLGALVLARGLKAHGGRSEFIGRVARLPNDEFLCHTVPQSIERWVKFRNRISNGLRVLRYGRPANLFSSIGFGLSPHRHSAVRAADIVVVQWAHAATLGPSFWRWLEREGGRVVVMLRDMWLFTGGCHFSGECLGYQTGCVTCPVLGSVSQRVTSTDIERKRRALRHIGAVVAISEDIARRARSSVVLRDAPIYVIPNAIDTTAFRPMSKTEARALLGLPLEGRIVAFGALNLSEERKGALVLQHIVATMGNTPGLHWATFGGNPFPMPPATTAFGLVKDRARLNAIYAAADVFLMPSLQETFGKVTAEALSSGTPVIAFRDTPAEEILTDRSGWLVPHGDATAFQTALEYALARPTQELAAMGLAGREHILANFSPEGVAERHMELYRSLVAGSTLRQER